VVVQCACVLFDDALPPLPLSPHIMLFPPCSPRVVGVPSGRFKLMSEACATPLGVLTVDQKQHVIREREGNVCSLDYTIDNGTITLLTPLVEDQAASALEAKGTKEHAASMKHQITVALAASKAEMQAIQNGEGDLDRGGAVLVEVGRLTKELKKMDAAKSVVFQRVFSRSTCELKVGESAYVEEIMVVVSWTALRPVRKIAVRQASDVPVPQVASDEWVRKARDPMNLLRAAEEGDE
jgi:hypothetical protein